MVQMTDRIPVGTDHRAAAHEEFHGRNDRMRELRDLRPDTHLPRGVNAARHQDLPAEGAIEVVFPLDQQHVDASLHEQESDCRPRRNRRPRPGLFARSP
jgi:hypothetical protein